MKHSTFTKFLSLTLAFALCGFAPSAAAWQQPAPQDRPLQNQSNVPQQLNQQAKPVEPARPENPTLQQRDEEEELPDAPSQQPQTVTTNPQTAQPATTQSTQSQTGQPLGTAAAESGKAVGGPASRPAGMALAPAKQKRTRSILLKVGAILGGAAALGTVYALSKGSSSTPPNSGR